MTSFHALVGSNAQPATLMPTINEAIVAELKGITHEIDPAEVPSEHRTHEESDAIRTAYGPGCQTFVGRYCIADLGQAAPHQPVS